MSAVDELDHLIATRPDASAYARYVVRTICQRHVDETPFDETPHEWYARATRSEAALNAILCVRINRADMNEVITTIENIQSLEAGTYAEIDQNAALTVNNVPDIADRLNARLNREIAELLTSAEPNARRAEDKVPA